MGKEWKPFSNLDEAVRAGHGHLIMSDGEERTVRKKLNREKIITNNIPVIHIHSSSAFEGVNPESLMIAIEEARMQGVDISLFQL